MGCTGRIAVALAVAAVSFGQEPDVVIRSTTELVQVHVVATDAHGSRVADLKRGDFEVLDNHKPQPLTLFTACLLYTSRCV